MPTNLLYCVAWQCEAGPRQMSLRGALPMVPTRNLSQFNYDSFLFHYRLIANLVTKRGTEKQIGDFMIILSFS